MAVAGLPLCAPVAQPTQFALVIKRKTATALGISLPESGLATATELIE